jgi:hypothetical protein
MALGHGYNSEKAGTSAKAESKFLAPKVEIKCTETTYEWTLVGKATTLPTTPKYAGCEVGNGALKGTPATVTDECKGGIIFNEPESVEGPPNKAKGKVTIAKGCKVLIKVKNLTAACEIKIEGEQNLGSASGKNLKETAGSFESSIEGKVTGIAYTAVTKEGGCLAGGLEKLTGTNGEYTQGPTTIKGIIIE